MATAEHTGGTPAFTDFSTSLSWKLNEFRFQAKAARALMCDSEVDFDADDATTPPTSHMSSVVRLQSLVDMAMRTIQREDYLPGDGESTDKEDHIVALLTIMRYELEKLASDEQLQ